MRLLHARADRLRGRLRQGRPCRQRRRDPRIYERQSVPLRRLSQHCRCHQAGQRKDGGLTMMPFQYQREDSAGSAVKSPNWTAMTNASAVDNPTQYLAGGTTLIDLMKLNVMRPQRVIDINALEGELGKIELGADGLKLGALARMAQVADNPDVKANYPVIAQSLTFAASQQIRNMASLGGNVLQRT